MSSERRGRESCRSQDMLVNCSRWLDRRPRKSSSQAWSLFYADVCLSVCHRHVLVQWAVSCWRSPTDILVRQNSLAHCSSLACNSSSISAVNLSLEKTHFLLQLLTLADFWFRILRMFYDSTLPVMHVCYYCNRQGCQFWQKSANWAIFGSRWPRLAAP